MKKIFVLIQCLFFSIISYSQSDYLNELKNNYNFDIVDDGIVFSRTYSISNELHSSLFDKVEQAIYLSIKDANDVIVYSNKEASTLILRDYILALSEFPEVIYGNYVMKITVDNLSYKLKLKVDQYSVNSKTSKPIFRGLILQNYPFGNALNAKLQVPDKCFEGLCKNIDLTLNKIYEKIVNDDI